MKPDAGTAHSWMGRPSKAMLVAHIRRNIGSGASQPGDTDLPSDVAEALALQGDFVWRTLQRLGVRDADLEDVMQEVFVVFSRQLRAFEGNSKITTWLYSICVRVASTHRRRAWVRREVPTSRFPDGPSLDIRPDEALETARKRQQLQEVLDLMSVERRALLVMYELDEMTCQEIAEVLGIPVGTVHSRLHAAREEFKSALKRWQARSRPAMTSQWPFARSK